MKISRFAGFGAIALALAGCQQNKTSDAGTSDAATDAATGAFQAPDAKPGIAVTGGVLVLPVVKGRPGAAYFAVANGGRAATSLVAVTVSGAGKAEMHETRGGAMAPLTAVPIGPGESVGFERGGKHVMVFDIPDTVKPGATAEVTLTFAGGDKVSAPLRVESMAGAPMDHPTAHGGMEGMGHGEPD